MTAILFSFILYPLKVVYYLCIEYVYHHKNHKNGRIMAEKKELHKIQADVFARLLNDRFKNTESRYAFFLGAGCSVSSGIPSAGTLVKYIWLQKLRDIKSPKTKDIDGWAKGQFKDYDPNNTALIYGNVIESLFPLPVDRQREMERLCENKFPGFGYAVLARLIANSNDRFNVALTTNFDDLIADALYLYSNARPLVINHESLAGFIRPTHSRSLVVKLHGDHRLAPLNLPEEISKLKKDIEEKIRALLHDRGLIFIGYGGNDEGIANMLKSVPDDALLNGVYWVHKREPAGKIAEWLKERIEKKNDVFFVEIDDFDKMMLLLRENLPHIGDPDEKRFEETFNRYNEDKMKLLKEIAEQPAAAPLEKELRKAAESAGKTFTNWWAVEMAASIYKKTDPDKADEIYKKGIENFKKSHQLLGNYAIFLTDIRKEYDEAERYYKRSLEIDPNSANKLGNYASFLKDIRKEYDEAERYYKRSLEIDPNNANKLGNYASFLKDIRKEYDEAERYYKRSLEIDPNNANKLGNYASFLHTIRKEYDEAERYYKRSLEIDPNSANNLGNYASFLHTIRKEYDEAERYYKRFLEIDPNSANNLGNYAGMLLGLGREQEGAEYLERALKSPDFNNNKTLQVECWYYIYSNRPPEFRREALKNVKKLLLEGVRSIGWDFSLNIERAKTLKHPQIKWLPLLADVIAEKKDIKRLEEWDDWKNI